MGLSFDSNGKYIGWSDIFDYSSLETINASEELPAPEKITYKATEDGINIDKYLDVINAQQAIIDNNNYTEQEINLAKARKLKAIAKLLKDTKQYARSINNNGKMVKVIEVSYTKNRGNEILNILNNHEFSKIPTSLLESSNKNFISSHIQTVIQDLTNMVAAYTPITMEDLKTAAALSPKGQSAAKLTMLNPAMKMIMQNSNMVGKNVIGISANGEKGSFMWNYYLNEFLRNHPEEGSGEFQKKLDRVKFSFTTSRVIGRSKGRMSVETINTLPDINVYQIKQSVWEQLGNHRTGILTVDLLISQLLSAATDFRK